MVHARPFAAVLALSVGLASAFGLVLAALTPLSATLAISACVGSVATVFLVLYLLQRWFMWRNVKNLYPIAELRHVELGRVKVYKHHWQSGFAAGPLAGCEVSCPNSAGHGPSDIQVALLRSIRYAQQQVLTDACHAAAAIDNIAEAKTSGSDFQAALLRLEPPDAFTLFLQHRQPDEEQPVGIYVRFRGMLVFDAGRTPLRE